MSGPHDHPDHEHADHGHGRLPATDPACAVAHGEVPLPTDARVLVAVFASPVAQYLLHFGREAGFRTVLIEPDPARQGDAAGQLSEVCAEPAGELIGPDTDVVVTDHDRPELGPVLRAVLASKARWVGVMGSPRHTAPHMAALAELGVPEADIARVHRPIGLNIGSRTPAEIAISTLAGLIADRNSRPGGFGFPSASPAG
jgi:xanthine/CO dehydrogenase XdhC/CoxF family maturation factor